ncbi:MAG: GHKL domain-containing protein [Clostridia bacterium]|nr:GHKL domain-containing protein [Clostridia bacterium]
MIYLLVEIAATILDGSWLIWFVSRFTKRSPLENKNGLLFPAAYTIIQLICDHLLPSFSAIPMFVMVICSVGYALSFNWRKIFSALLSSALFMTGMMLPTVVLSLLFTEFVTDFQSVITGAAVPARVLYLLIGKSAQFALLHLCLVLFKKRSDLSMGYGLLITGFNLLCIVISSILWAHIAEAQEGESLRFLQLVVLGITIFSVLFYFFIHQIGRLQRAKYELKLMQEKTEFEKKRVEEAEVIWDNIRKTKHDLKNHLTVVGGYLEAGENEVCKEYLEKLTQTVDSMGNLIRSGNEMLDYLINAKLSRAKDIKVLLNGSAAPLAHIDPVDLSCIVGNILDNAIEAQQDVPMEKRQIELRFAQHSGCAVILCKNTVNGRVLQNGKLKKTAKSDPESHGLGHQIVEASVKKYGGWVNYFEEDGVFGVQITIPEKTV